MTHVSIIDVLKIIIQKCKSKNIKVVLPVKFDVTIHEIIGYIIDKIYIIVKYISAIITTLKVIYDKVIRCYDILT